MIASGAARDEQHHRMAGRLLQRLQQRVRSFAAHAVRRFDDDRPVRRFERIPRREVDEAAHLANPDVARIGVLRMAFAVPRAAKHVAGRKPDDVRVRPLRNQPARAANPTGHCSPRPPLPSGGSSPKRRRSLFPVPFPRVRLRLTLLRQFSSFAYSSASADRPVPSAPRTGSRAAARHLPQAMPVRAESHHVR